MNWTKLAYIISIATIFFLLLFIGGSLSQNLADPKPDEPATMVHYGKLVVTDNKSLVSYSITNYEEHSMNYTIRLISGDSTYYNFTQHLDAGSSMTHSLHIFGDIILNSNFTIDIYKENDTIPFHSNTYILR